MGRTEKGVVSLGLLETGLAERLGNGHIAAEFGEVEDVLGRLKQAEKESYECFMLSLLLARSFPTMVGRRIPLG